MHADAQVQPFLHIPFSHPHHSNMAKTAFQRHAPFWTLALCVITTAFFIFHFHTPQMSVQPSAATSTSVSPSRSTTSENADTQRFSPSTNASDTSEPWAAHSPVSNATVHAQNGVADSTTQTNSAESEAADEGPITATASVQRKTGVAIPLKSISGLFKQVLLDPTESIQVSLDLGSFDPNKPVRIVANNGGSVNRQVGPTIIDPAAAGAKADFTFGVGATYGAYTVEVLQGTRTELFDFWVGPLPPRGEAGPPRDFTGNNRP